MTSPCKLSIFLGTGINGHRSTSSGILNMSPNPSCPQDPPPKQYISPDSVRTIVCTSPHEACVNFKSFNAYFKTENERYLKHIKASYWTYSDTSGNRLVWVAIFIGWEAASVGMPELAASTSTPRIEVTLVKHSHCMGFAARYLLHLHLAKSYDQFGLWLIRTAIFVFRHTARIWVSKLTASTATP